MSLARDWLKTLWNVSYKGVPFLVESDGEGGARRIVKHLAPMRDGAFLEDLGEDARGFDVSAYVASSAADADAAAVIAVCATRGPGTLVLPTHGPLLVRCLRYRRDRSKDRHGYIALRLEFVREDLTAALVTVASLANLIFVTAETAAASVAQIFADSLTVAGQPDFVQAAAIGGVEDFAASLEAVRSMNQVDPAVGAAQQREIEAIFNEADEIADAPLVLTGRCLAAARALAAGMPPLTALRAFEQLYQSAPAITAAPSDATPSTVIEVANAAASRQALRLAALVAYAEAIARLELADRPAAITLRADVADYFEAELNGISAGDIDLAHSVGDLRDKVIDYLSRTIIDLAPVVQIEANLRMPSLFWAWRMYGDPARSTELAARNRVPHPSFMPTAFEALAR